MYFTYIIINFVLFKFNKIIIFKLLFLHLLTFKTPGSKCFKIYTAPERKKNFIKHIKKR